jgi:conserved domain protein
MGTIVHLIHQVLAKPTIQDITTVTHANNITGYSTGVESKHQHRHFVIVSIHRILQI